jgi:DNA-binding transcriptional LysR family regulator
MLIIRITLLPLEEHPMIEIDDLRSFIEVLDSGGFNRAARRLGLSKSIVSRRVARLEDRVGARLLARSTRGVSATDGGLELKARGERILAELADAEEALAQRGGALVGRLRLSAPLSFGVRHVAPVLAELACRHPRLELDISYSDRVADLVGERFDAAIRIGVLQDSSLIARRIAPVRTTVVASTAYLDRHGRPATPQDLLHHQCLIYTGQRNPEWRFRSGKRWITIRPEGRLRSDSGDALLTWMLAGLGVAPAPSFLVADAIRDGLLEPLLRDFPMPEAAIYLVRPPGPHVPAKVRALTETLVEHFGQEPFWDACLMAERRADRVQPPPLES